MPNHSQITIMFATDRRKVPFLLLTKESLEVLRRLIEHVADEPVEKKKASTRPAACDKYPEIRWNPIRKRPFVIHKDGDGRFRYKSVAAPGWENDESALEAAVEELHRYFTAIIPECGGE